jgi:hypothetical protein
MTWFLTKKTAGIARELNTVHKIESLIPHFKGDLDSVDGYFC